MTKSLTISIACISAIFLTTACRTSHHANIDFADGSYTGPLNKEGKKNGTGIYRWHDGSIYEGGYRDDLRHGKGRFMWANGETYSGNYHHDERTGKGIYLWPDGSRYEGDFLAGMRHGRGIFTSPEGIVYEGEWFDDMQHGAGTLTYPDGRIVSGIWRKGELVSKPAPLPVHSTKPIVQEPLAELEQAPAIAVQTNANATEKKSPVTNPPKNTSTGIPEDEKLDRPKSAPKNPNQEMLPPSQAKPAAKPAPAPKSSVEKETSSLIPAEKGSDYSEKDQPDWVGTVEQAEAQFSTELVDGIDTIRSKTNGVPFSGRMRIVTASGVPQGEVELKNGRLHGEEIFYDANGQIEEKNTWIEGRLTSP